jgi:phosphomannomutase
MLVRIADVMEQSDVKFGTSGARGLSDAITDRVAYAYTVAFLQHVQARFGESAKRAVAIAGDLRPSTPRIANACAAAAVDLGYAVHWGGEIPSPAVALYGIQKGMPSIMVTGSHIPDDRNGIKFNRADGEIDKVDELGIRGSEIELNEGLFDNSGALIGQRPQHETVTEIEKSYKARFPGFFGAELLAGVRVGVYQHSTVGRDLIVDVLRSVGAKVTPLGRSTVFVPVDTEAVRPEDVALAAEWARGGEYDAIVSADGDCDRPLISDERGHWLRGDVIGALCARLLGATAVATPVSCNTVVELCGAFKQVTRTRIGSPFVIEHMQLLAQTKGNIVVGYEANGGFLQQSPLVRQGRTLAPLPTRDALLPIITLLAGAREARLTLSRFVAQLPPRFTASDRIKGLPTAKSQALIKQLTPDNQDNSALERAFSDLCGSVRSVDYTDGLRITFENAEVLHLRPSGNAPELRCYSEADSDERATGLTREVLNRIATGVVG